MEREERSETVVIKKCEILTFKFSAVGLGICLWRAEKKEQARDGGKWKNLHSHLDQ